MAQEAEERAASAESEVEDLRRECAEARRQVEELSRKLDSLAADHISAEALEAAVSRAEVIPSPIPTIVQSSSDACNLRTCSKG